MVNLINNYFLDHAQWNAVYNFADDDYQENIFE